MRLKKYLKENKISQYAFARALEATRSAVSLYCKGRRRPEPEIMARIKKLTNGNVTEVDFPKRGK